MAEVRFASKLQNETVDFVLDRIGEVGGTALVNSFAQAISQIPVGSYFILLAGTADNPTGSDIRYQRTAGAPGYALTADQPVSKNALAAPTGADFIGTSDGGNVQDGLDIRPTSLALSSDSGASLIGTSDGVDVQGALAARTKVADLASAGGSDLVGYVPPSGNTLRSIRDILYDSGIFPESFGAKGDGLTNDTVAFNLASVTAASTGRTLRLRPKAIYMVDSWQWTNGLCVSGFGAEIRQPAGVTTSHVTMPSGVVRGMNHEGYLLRGNGAAGVHGVYLDARGATASDTGGVYYSTFRFLSLRNYSGHSWWFRGGNNRYLSGATYNFLTPHQFIEMNNIDIERPAGNTLGHAMVLTGQCGQIEFSGRCRFDGNGTAGFVGLNYYQGREFIGSTIPGSPYDAALGFTLGSSTPASGSVQDDIAPSVIYGQFTSQQAERAIWLDRGELTLNSRAWFEQLKRAVVLTTNAQFTSYGVHFANAGSDGGNGYLIERGGGTTVLGHSNDTNGATDRKFYTSNSAVPRTDAPEDFWMVANGDPAGQNTNPTVTLSQAGSALSTLGNRSVLVNPSTTPIQSIVSYLNVGEYLTLRAIGAQTIIGDGTTTGANFRVPNNRMVLRVNECAIFKRIGSGTVEWFLVGDSRAELRATAMPTSGYFETGEFVRNTSAFAAGTITLGWQRLTTGTNHVSGTDWRVVQATAV